jgi:predicted small lipoprotein YifL
MTALLRAALLGAAIGLLLAACGKKGPPEPPGPSGAITYPKTYPTH